jgi:hypothetical protein
MSGAISVRSDWQYFPPFFSESGAPNFWKVLLGTRYTWLSQRICLPLGIFAILGWIRAPLLGSLF